MLTIGPIRIDLARRVVTHLDGKLIPLTGAEFRVVQALAVAHGRDLTRETLTRVALHRSLNTFDRSIDQLVFGLRRKLPMDQHGMPLIQTVRGVGYWMQAPDQAEAAAVPDCLAA